MITKTIEIPEGQYCAIFTVIPDPWLSHLGKRTFSWNLRCPLFLPNQSYFDRGFCSGKQILGKRKENDDGTTTYFLEKRTDCLTCK